MWEWLTETRSFPNRDACGDWTPGMVIAYRMAHTLTALCMFAIPAWILVFYRTRRDDIPSAWVLLFFFALFLSAGFSYLCNVIALVWPAQRLFTLIDCFVAVACLSTVVMLPVAMRQADRFPSVAQFARKIKELDAEKLTRIQLIFDLHTRDEAKSREIEARDQLIRELRHKLANLETPAENQREIIQLLQAKLEEIRLIGRED